MSSLLAALHDAGVTPRVGDSAVARQLAEQPMMFSTVLGWVNDASR